MRNQSLPKNMPAQMHGQKDNARKIKDHITTDILQKPKATDRSLKY
jgi:hypothetical protein